jgi:hypothetical protein
MIVFRVLIAMIRMALRAVVRLVHNPRVEKQQGLYKFAARCAKSRFFH